MCYLHPSRANRNTKKVVKNIQMFHFYVWEYNIEERTLPCFDCFIAGVFAEYLTIIEILQSAGHSKPNRNIQRVETKMLKLIN